MESDKQLAIIQQEIDALKRTTDALESGLAEQKGPWYSKPSIVISALALAFSMATTLFSYYTANNANILAEKREVLAILQRITRLPIEHFEALKKFKDSPYGPQLVALVNEESLLLLDQAESLMRRHPGEYTSTEYFSVATALGRSRPTPRVLALLQKALAKASNAGETSVASRAIGDYYFAVRNPQQARKYYRRALDAWRLSPETTMAMNSVWDAQVLVGWAGAEASLGNIAEAKTLVAQAEVALNRMPGSLEAGVIRNQIQSIRAAIQQARAPLPGPRGDGSLSPPR